MRGPGDWAYARAAMTQISPMLAVGDGKAAIAFYQQAFGATVRWLIDAGGHVVAGLEIGGAEFFLADESPPHGTRGPASAGFTTVRLELFVDDPEAAHARAVAAGATARGPVTRYEYPTTSGKQLRMLQGSIMDPFGHMWLIGKFLD
jgi:PhnB protein